MQTDLAQMVSLVSYGNEFLQSGTINKKHYEENTVFQGCNKVDFHDISKSMFSSKPTQSISANNPEEWFKLLKKEQCNYLRLRHIPSKKSEFGPEYKFAGMVGGGGTWLIETIFKGYSHYWENDWKVTKQNAPDKKIWEVNYTRRVDRFTTTNDRPNVNETKSKLAEILKDLIEFCNQQKVKYWPEVFQKADTMLSDPTPNKLYYHHDLLVTKNYSLAAQQLIFAAGEAWVFRGMGSWNDMGFNEPAVQEKYLDLSQKLYDLLIQGIIASANSF